MLLLLLSLLCVSLLVAPLAVGYSCSTNHRSRLLTRMSLDEEIRSDGSSNSSSSDEVQRYLMQKTVIRHPKQKKKNNLKANVMWRAIPMDDLRRHPLYIPLHEAGPEIISSTKDVSKFRQSSYQWNILHTGRLTTSLVAGSLGLLESKASTQLDVPKSLRGSQAVQAIYHLLDDPIDDYNALINTNITGYSAASRSADVSPWKFKSDKKIEKFANNAYCVYRPRPAASGGKRLMSSINEAKLSWGNCQEATAILVALNYFKDTAKISEIGLNAFENVLQADASPHFQASEWLQIKEWMAAGQLPPLGSSPDGMIHHHNGTAECLEVKCLSPFTLSPDKKSMSLKTYVPAKVATFHVPQLMFHMLCSGTSSVVLVTLTAQKGARIYRVHRDNELISLMLYFIKLFYTSYVVPARNTRSKLPSSEKLIPRNFFFERPRNSTDNFGYSSDDTDKYLRLLELIRTTTDRAELVADVDQLEVQRSPGREELLEA